MELVDKASQWFHEKWDFPKEAYIASMEQCLTNQYSANHVPQWYVAVHGETIIAGLGVIENDFHDRRDLTPNICSVYVEEAYRSQGIAGEMLRFAYQDLSDKGIRTIYLVTDHSSFYERYGWEFVSMVRGEGESELTRLYRYCQE